MSRIYNDNADIDVEKIKEFYKKRANDKVDIDIDAPVVLCGDNDKNKINKWNEFEINNRIKLLELDSNSNVLELGCGTGRMSKYIINAGIKSYIGIDYVKELIDIAKNREDIKKGKNISFLDVSFKDFLEGNKKNKFNRFFISGGVLMYINDYEANECIEHLASIMEENSVVYISEPIALENRLTLNEFYSENLKSNYSAVYRRKSDYIKLFEPLFRKGFYLIVNEEFFNDDIKKQSETKQWLFVLKNS